MSLKEMYIKEEETKLEAQLRAFKIEKNLQTRKA
jgi:hypothetical protein